jgi:DNA repair protein RadD
MISTQVQAEWANIDDVGYSRWRKEGKPDSVRVTYYCGLIKVSEWLCPDHGGYAADRYIKRKTALGATAATTEDAMSECDQWTRPSRIKVKPNGKFYDIVQIDYSKPKRLTEAEWADLQEPLF